MKRSRFTEEQVIAILWAQETGVPVADLCRKHGVSSPTFFKWQAKCDGLDVSEAGRLRALEDDNAKLKPMLADAMLDHVALKDLLGKNGGARGSAGGRGRRRRRRRPNSASRDFVADQMTDGRRLRILAVACGIQ